MVAGSNIITVQVMHQPEDIPTDSSSADALLTGFLAMTVRLRHMTLATPVRASTSIPSLTVPTSSSAKEHQLPRDSIALDSFDKIENEISNVVSNISSLEQLETWLRAQEYIESVRLDDSLIKTAPPQREFIVEFRMNDGSIRTKAIDVFVLGTHRYKYRELHDTFS
jgi:hypothetical protein